MKSVVSDNMISVDNATKQANIIDICFVADLQNIYSLCYNVV